MEVKIKNTSGNPIPEYATKGSSGIDLIANLGQPITIYPMGRVLVPTGIHIQIPEGYEAQVRPRSGNAIKKGITVLNTPGTIDSDFTGDIGVILINLSKVPVTINNGDKIAQLVFSPIVKASFKHVEKLSDTERGEGGFGHTGDKVNTPKKQKEEKKVSEKKKETKKPSKAKGKK